MDRTVHESWLHFPRDTDISKTEAERPLRADVLVPSGSLHDYQAQVSPETRQPCPVLQTSTAPGGEVGLG